ncbi:MAG: sulfite exporter TauE/SafE family protein [Phycisphaerales bacterium]|nr:MAG: sulfite exporter TauE/SafE family protein [Phycisphaerales bacterium]
MISTLDKAVSESPAWALLTVFWIGAIASLSSCTVIRLPVVMGCMAGPGTSKKRGVVLTALFCLGLVVSYVLLGWITAFAGEVVHKVLALNKYVFWFLGVVLFGAGVWISGLLSLRSLPDQWQTNGGRLRRGGALGTFLLGGLFGLLETPACPCCGAGLLVLAGVVVSKELSSFGLLVFASFALGQSVPVLAVGVLTGLVKPDFVRRVRTRICSIEQRIQLIAGNVLMVLGVYLIVVG